MTINNCEKCGKIEGIITYNPYFDVNNAFMNYSTYISFCKYCDEDEVIKYIEYKENEKQNIQKKYYENHQACPKCKSKSFETTLVEYIINSKDDKDLNRVKCSCGFEGVWDDLIKE